MIYKLKTIINRELFYPSILSLFFNPVFLIRKRLLAGIKKNAHFMGGVFLDFGCGSKPYKEVFNHVEKYIGLDVKKSGHDHQNEQIDCYYDGKIIPFNRNCFDSIFSSEVLEHIFNPDEILDELNRVLKFGGFILITTPFVWDEHEVPFDFGRYTSFGLVYLLKKHGFQLISLEKSGNHVETIAQLWSVYVAQRITSKNRMLRALLTVLLLFPVNLFGIILSRLLPQSHNLYLSNIVVAQKQYQVDSRAVAA